MQPQRILFMWANLAACLLLVASGAACQCGVDPTLGSADDAAGVLDPDPVGSGDPVPPPGTDPADDDDMLAVVDPDEDEDANGSGSGGDDDDPAGTGGGAGSGNGPPDEPVIFGEPLQFDFALGGEMVARTLEATEDALAEGIDCTGPIDFGELTVTNPETGEAVSVQITDFVVQCGSLITIEASLGGDDGSPASVAIEVTELTEESDLDSIIILFTRK